jgi:hypothetical protein
MPQCFCRGASRSQLQKIALARYNMIAARQGAVDAGCTHGFFG